MKTLIKEEVLLRSIDILSFSIDCVRVVQHQTVLCTVKVNDNTGRMCIQSYRYKQLVISFVIQVNVILSKVNLHSLSFYTFYIKFTQLLYTKLASIL